MATLTSDLRKTLEKTIIKARDLTEAAVNVAVQGLGVGSPRAATHLSEEDQTLRRQLRAHARSLGDRLHGDDRQEVRKLIQEGAYEHWHRMLFARFLAENGLLLHPELGVGVTLTECEDLAQEEGCNAWELAGRYASRMLPQIFRPEDPVLRLRLAPEHQQALERLLADLPAEVFQADDSLGWVYQFWQSKRKDEVNASEVKIGAEELPAVTQLFTEDYMVDFLLHNSLGAWWATRHPGQACPVPLPYLRTLEDGTPAAGKFEGWPDGLKDFTLLDPCCGSGHFLVAAFRLLVALRRADEGLTAAQAVDAVLTQNLHGLELDARCVEIAVFALALAAWTTLGEDGRPLGVRPDMPSPAVACCGLKPAAKVEDWLALVPEDHPKADRLKAGLRRLHSTFQQAPLLGSLLDPGREAGGLFEADYEELQGLLARALEAEDGDTAERALSAKGLMEAARLLGVQYNLVITNVPYRKRGDHCEELKNFCAAHYPEAKADLANVFLERCIELSHQRGVVQIVMPQNWLFQVSYKSQRESLLNRVHWNLLAWLGPGAFETISGEVVKAILFTITAAPAKSDFQLRGVDASAPKTAKGKAALLQEGEVVAVSQQGQLGSPDASISICARSKAPLLAQVAGSFQGISTGDNPRFVLFTWELMDQNAQFAYFQTPADRTEMYCGMHSFINNQVLAQTSTAAIRGREAWTKLGVGISRVGSLAATLYAGNYFANTMPAVIPSDPELLPALWCFLSSADFLECARSLNQSLSIDNGYLAKLPFQPDYWAQIAAERYPFGLPKPYSEDPTQWIFHGHPRPTTDPLQVALARLVGYQWPAETDEAMELSEEARTWVARCTDLDALVDDDGILPIPAMRGEQPAEGRLRQMLAAAFGVEWSTSKEQELLQAVGYGGKSLEAWLRDGYFEQHCKLFHQRPFIWQVWDGLRDGFSVLVNYHKLDRKGLESLTYSYLGDWINRQKDAVSRNESGAPGKLEKALELQKKLVAILEGDAPHDIFVRWKPLEQQPIGWEPDLNDGVRLNIRPFMTAGILRKDPKINWNKDRGTDVESAPWYNLGLQYGGKKGDRINDHHLGLDERRNSRGSR
jgi:hypothetical protein